VGCRPQSRNWGIFSKKASLCRFFLLQRNKKKEKEVSVYAEIGALLRFLL
jgi:hypothetical protein